MRYAGNPSRSCLRSPSPPALTAREPSEPLRGAVRLPGPGRPPLPAAHRRLPRTGRAGPSPGTAKQSPEASRPAERPGHAAAQAGEGRGGEVTGAALPLSRSRPLGPRRMRGGAGTWRRPPFRAQAGLVQRLKWGGVAFTPRFSRCFPS